MARGARAAAVAIHDAANKLAEKAQRLTRAEVLDTSPLTVELPSGMVLDADEFDMTQMVRLYHRLWGIEVGDVVLLMRQGDDWLVVDVSAPKALRGRRQIGLPKGGEYVDHEARAAIAELRAALIDLGVVADG